jgi:uncharacterized protein
LAVNIRNRGFGSMGKVRQKEIASRGGRAAHEKGTAHTWTSETAKLAAKKSAQARRAAGEELRRRYLLDAAPKTT